MDAVAQGYRGVKGVRLNKKRVIIDFDDHTTKVVNHKSAKTAKAQYERMCRGIGLYKAQSRNEDFTHE